MIYNKYKLKDDIELKKLMKNNDFYAINEYGERLFQKERYSEALEYFEKASKLGSNMAINNIGIYYLEIENNIGNSKKYFLRAIEKGNIVALNNLGIAYDKETNYEEAKKYYLIAIDKKCSFAYNNLGNLYEEIYKNYEEAKKLYRKNFKENQDTEALINLFYLYNRLKNKKRAIRYLKLACGKGNKEAKHILYHLENDKKEHEK